MSVGALKLKNAGKFWIFTTGTHVFCQAVSLDLRSFRRNINVDGNERKRAHRNKACMKAIAHGGLTSVQTISDW